MNRTLFLFFLSISFFQASAQQIIIGNGGIFGTTDYANLGVYNPGTQSYTSLDTVEVTSLQDVLIEQDRFVYLAAQDSIVKYDLFTGKRIAIGGFGAPSTIKLGIYNNKLLVGNWYGAASGNLRIFDKNTLAFQDSIPEITKGAKDFLIIGDFAYISQNEQVNFQDTMGYLATVNLLTNSFVQFDTLSTNGEELGRLINIGDTIIYSINGRSNSISSYHIGNGTTATVSTTVDLQPTTTGTVSYYNGTNWYLPFNNGIGLYDLVNNTVVSANILPLPGSYAFAVDTASQQIYVTAIDYVSQSNNAGVIYNYNGDTTGSYPVGFSPELLAIWNSNVTVQTQVTAPLEQFSVKLFPNPSSNHLNIQANTTIENMMVIDLQGRLLREFTVNKDTQVISVQDLSSGTYFLRLQTAEGWQTTKFIKK